MASLRSRVLLGCIAAAVLGPLALVGLIEVTTRIAGLEAGFTPGPSPQNCMRRSALLGIDFRPNCAGRLGKTRFRTNSLGLRGGEVRDDGSLRILTIGDSCTWGWHVAEEESYPAVLQGLLDRRSGSPRYQVINAGFPGASSHRGLRYLRERGLGLDPAIVIAAYGFNDTSKGPDDELQLAYHQKLMPLLALNDFFVDHLRFYRWARWRLAESAESVKPAGKRVPADKFGGNLDEIVRLGRAHGARVMLLTFTAMRRPGPYRSALFDTAEKLDVPLVVYDGPKLDMVHPTAEGNRRLAAEILARLEAQGWLGGAEPPRS